MRIKICGITRPVDAEQALGLGADAVGCVFHPASVRAVNIRVARDISSAAAGSGILVGLFVDPTAEQVQAVLESVPLDVLQFHGTETPEFCDQFARPYIKAVAMTADADLTAMSERYASAQALLLDSAHEGQFGGTGTRFDWSWADRAVSKRTILAGGLNPDNVTAAIEQVGPAAVDVSSGVEKEKGLKDLAKMRAFIEAAKWAMGENRV